MGADCEGEARIAGQIAIEVLASRAEVADELGFELLRREGADAGVLDYHDAVSGRRNEFDGGPVAFDLIRAILRQHQAAAADLLQGL